MKFNLSGFNDLGKCSMGTLKDTWDTDKDKIFVGETLNDKTEIAIKNVEDLFPYLWCNPFITTGEKQPDGTIANCYFFIGEPQTWFRYQYTNIIETYKKEIAKMQKRFPKYKNRKVAESKLQYYADAVQRNTEYLNGVNNLMLNNQKKILEDNINA